MARALSAATALLAFPHDFPPSIASTAGAYNFEDNNSQVGNDFMNDIQGYAATHPVACVEGNHERLGNFSEYTSRFASVGLYGAGAVSGTSTPRYYSFSRGLTHFLVFSAEAYTYKSGAEFIANQLAFMKADLAAVNRAVTPWVVALVHKACALQCASQRLHFPPLPLTLACACPPNPTQKHCVAQGGWRRRLTATLLLY